MMTSEALAPVTTRQCHCRPCREPGVRGPLCGHSLHSVSRVEKVLFQEPVGYMSLEWKVALILYFLTIKIFGDKIMSIGTCEIRIKRQATTPRHTLKLHPARGARVAPRWARVWLCRVGPFATCYSVTCFPRDTPAGTTVRQQRI